MTWNQTSRKGGGKNPGPVGKGPCAAWRRKGWLLLFGAILCGATAGFFVAKRFWRTDETPQQGEQPPVARQPALPEPTPVPPEPTPVPPEPPPRSPGSTPTPPRPAPTRQAVIDALKKEAIELAERLMKEFPNSIDPIVLMGKVHQALGNSAEALKCFEECVKRNPNRADTYDAMGMIALDKGEYEKAAALWRKALEIDPRMPAVHNRLACALMSLGKTKEAMALAEKDIQISPRSSSSYFLLGQGYLQLKEYQKANENYQAAIRIAPNLTNAYYGLASACARLGQQDKAKQYREEFQRLKAEDRTVLKGRKVTFDDMVAVRRNVAGAYTDAGRHYRRYHFLWKAEKHWLRAATLDPRNRRCRECLASLYQSNDREREALSMYEQLGEIDPQDPVYCLNIGVANARLQRFDAAEKAFLKARELAPQQSLGHRALAELYLHTNRNLSEARTLAQTAVRLEPIALNYSILSKAHDKNGDHENAVAAMQRAVELDPDNPRYRRIYELLQQRK